MRHDHAIIGAGPAGLAFACLLANTGLRTIKVEKLSATELACKSDDVTFLCPRAHRGLTL